MLLLEWYPMQSREGVKELKGVLKFRVMKLRSWGGDEVQGCEEVVQGLDEDGGGDKVQGCEEVVQGLDEVGGGGDKFQGCEAIIDGLRLEGGDEVQGLDESEGCDEFMRSNNVVYERSEDVDHDDYDYETENFMREDDFDYG
ncbi:hypothetical protein Leryth_011599 [Lithospermum erythrorhizon]|nr:hypothetical protein Leryth_011599 [Lithospermum erythrorhizon]